MQEERGQGNASISFLAPTDLLETQHEHGAQSDRARQLTKEHAGGTSQRTGVSHAAAAASNSSHLRRQLFLSVSPRLYSLGHLLHSLLHLGTLRFVQHHQAHQHKSQKSRPEFFLFVGVVCRAPRAYEYEQVECGLIDRNATLNGLMWAMIIRGGLFGSGTISLSTGAS